MHAICRAMAGASLLTAALARPAYDGQSSGTVPYSHEGFPTFSDSQLQTVQKIAMGTVPNSPPPESLSAQGALSLQLIEFNENFEVAFFASLLHNVSTGVDGYNISDKRQKNYIMATLNAVIAQEEIHAYNAHAALAHFQKQTIDPCPSYKFPVNDFQSAIAVATQFTDVVLGTLQDISDIVAESGDVGLPGAIASVIGQEGEQNGYYRILLNRNLIPSSLPFLTRATRDFAMSALQGTISGTCPGTETLVEGGLKIYGTLVLLSEPTAQNQHVGNGKQDHVKIAGQVSIRHDTGAEDPTFTFSMDVLSLLKSKNVKLDELMENCTPCQQARWGKHNAGTSTGNGTLTGGNTTPSGKTTPDSHTTGGTITPGGKATNGSEHVSHVVARDYGSDSNTTLSNFDWKNSNLYVQYINQQNVPIAETMKNIRVDGSMVTFEAAFPYDKYWMNGLTIAAVTVGTGFKSANEVAEHTLFGPALIGVN